MSFPLFLTLFRLLVSPFVLPFCIFYLSPYNNFFVNSALAVLFSVLSITDFFDGYLARRHKKVTAIGAMLDHMADKFLSYSALISLVAVHKIYFYWAILLIGREFFVCTLRMVALEYGYTIAVSLLGKAKTVVQSIFIIVALLHPGRDEMVSLIVWDRAYLIALAVTLLFSLGSAALYAADFVKLYREKMKSQDAA